MDIALRELRAVVPQDKEMVIIRAGTCGCISESEGSDPLGSLAVCDKGALIIQTSYSSEGSFELSPLCLPSSSLTSCLTAQLRRGTSLPVLSSVDASADTFFAGQGRRIPGFLDDNTLVLGELSARHPKDTLTMDMETGYLFYTAEKLAKKTMHVAAVHIIVTNRTRVEFLPDGGASIQPNIVKPILDTLVEYHLSKQN